jgi:hypothetical protein
MRSDTLLDTLLNIVKKPVDFKYKAKKEIDRYILELERPSTPKEKGYLEGLNDAKLIISKLVD